MKTMCVFALLSTIISHHINSMYDIGRFKEEMYTQMKDKTFHSTVHQFHDRRYDTNPHRELLVKAAQKTEAHHAENGLPKKLNQK